MDVEPLEIGAVKLLRPRRFADARGFLVEVWNRRTFAAAGLDVDFVQDNCSYSRHSGTLRGLHFQTAQCPQAKLIRVVRGAIFDVAVDLRRGAPSFGRFVSAVLTAAGGEQLFIPAGFAHGFCSLEAETEVAYKVSGFHSPEHEAGIIWDDPRLAIPWPLKGRAPVLSERDAGLPRFDEMGVLF